MARATKANEAAYKEFSLTGKNGNEFSGRLYDETYELNGGSYRKLSITVNGLAITGCKLIETSKAKFFSWPQYKAGKEYKNAIYFYNKEDLEDLKELTEHLLSL